MVSKIQEQILFLKRKFGLSSIISEKQTKVNKFDATEKKTLIIFVELKL